MTNSNMPRNGKFYYIFREFLIRLNRDLIGISSKMKKIAPELEEFDFLVMALEDRRFLSHRGIDLISVARETIKMLRGKKHGGASTIDMQMIRTMTGYKELSLRRKIYEMTLSLLINFKFSKRQIMQCYMDNAFFGSHMTGLKKACEKVYDKPLADLTSLEKARLAAMLLSPRPLVPNAAWEKRVAVRAAYAQAKRHLVKGCNY